MTGEVLDSTTRRIVGAFGSHSIFASRRNYISLEDLTTKPITDMNEINLRLDTIEDLVENEALRERINAIMPVLSFSYEDFIKRVINFSESIERFKDYANPNEILGILEDAQRIIDSQPEEIPTDFGTTEYRSERMRGFSEKYESLMTDGSAIRLINTARAVAQILVRHKDMVEYISSVASEARYYSYRNITLDKGAVDKIVGIFSGIEVPEDVRGIKYDDAALDLHNNMLAYVDAAKDAIEKGYKRPIVVPKEENCLVIREGYYTHKRTESDLVANDTLLDNTTPIEVLEGPNSAGKSWDILKAFDIAIRALSGSFVPDEYAKVSVRDRIILREKGAGDIISAFQKDCKNVVEATPPEGEYWLIGLDETFTSTESQGGEALTYGKIEYNRLINSVKGQGGTILLISNHYIDLHKAFPEDSGVRFSYFPFRKVFGANENLEDIQFPFTKKGGSYFDVFFRSGGKVSEIDYALSLAEIKGFDPMVLQYARERIAKRFGSGN